MIGCREKEVHDCCLKSYGVFYFSNVWWVHIPDVDCLGVKREHWSCFSVTTTFLWLSSQVDNALMPWVWSGVMQ